MEKLQKQKELLIKSLMKNGFLRSDSVIKAFRKTPRENFVPSRLKKYSYADEPLPIGSGQTISQPLTIAAMTEALDARPGNKILEVGTGSGYQAALLSEVVGESGRIITTERVEKLYRNAVKNLDGYKNVTILDTDGTEGWVKEAPYDRIIVTASAPSIPEPLIKQLNPGGKMIVPVGNEMFLVEKDGKGNFIKTFLGYYVFVPLIGKHGHKF